MPGGEETKDKEVEQQQDSAIATTKPISVPSSLCSHALSGLGLLQPRPLPPLFDNVPVSGLHSLNVVRRESYVHGDEEKHVFHVPALSVSHTAIALSTKEDAADDLDRFLAEVDLS